MKLLHLLLLLPVLSYATTPREEPPPPSIPYYFEGSVGLFYPTATLFQEIYSIGPIYGFEFDVQPYKGLVVWTSLNIFTSTGHSVGGNNLTSIFMVPVGMGLKYFIPLLRVFRPYLGAGVVPTYLHVNNYNSPYVSATNDGWGCGGIIKSGVLTHLWKRWFLDIFLNYTYLKTQLQNSPSPPVINYPVDASNLVFGAAIDYHF